MKITLDKLPFYSVFAAAFVPWVNGVTNSNVPGYIFNFMVLGLVGLWLAVNPTPRLRARLTSWMFSICFCFALVMALILHRIHPLTDFLVIAPITVAYTLILRSSPLTSADLLRQLRWLYSFHIAFIVFELVMFYFDSRFIFDILSGGRYRELPFQILGQIDSNIVTGGPNSLLLQAQAASQLVGCAILLSYLARDKNGRNNPYILILLLVLFLPVITNTSLLVFLILGVLAWLIKTNVNYTKIAVVLLTVLLGLIFFDQLVSVLFYRIAQGTAVDDKYVWYFTAPLSNLSSAELFQLLFGHGKDPATPLESGELGFITVAFIVGVFMIGLIFIWVASLLAAGFIHYKKVGQTFDLKIHDWRALLLLNIFLCAAWVMSTAHYTVITIPGGTHLFAFSLAIVIVATDRIRKPYRHQTGKAVGTNQWPYGKLSHR